jgi:5-oxopent-3-ene-1,2,5-tricarboxylate decarboxylase/2-hydroxyhepta-2,4-diene-1,7-dioate isomerase
MSVLQGPRRERRRVVLDGQPTWVDVADDAVALPDGTTVGPDELEHLSPAEPGTIVCVHLSYTSRAAEMGRDLSGAHPTYFLKPRSALSAHGRDVVRPDDCTLLNYEGELAAVVGTPMHQVGPEEVWHHLAGFTVANDFGVHDFRDTDAGSMLRVKGHDGFCPLGPGLVTGVDVRAATLSTYVNGMLVQRAPLAEMAWSIDVLLADLSRYLTLRPGDVVLTGTPANSRPVFPGDVVEVEVDGVGRLRNTVVRGPAPPAGAGFPPTVSTASLAVALGRDYQVLQAMGEQPSGEAYHRHRDALVAGMHIGA